MRLIDADAVKAVFEEKSSEAVCGVELCKAIINRIDEAPTVDAVPVIRCKDCVNCGTDDCAMHFEIDDKVYQWNRADDFCSLGERKEHEID